jgi:ribosomal peptide maturation radical SAM protein 1
MPFGGVDRPAIGISSIKAGLAKRGVECDLRYLNFDFAHAVGPTLYQWFADRGSHMIFAGEWMFAREFFGEALPPEHLYLEHLVRDRHVDARTMEAILHLRAHVRPFLEHCLRAVDWGSYDLVGFTSTFEQNLASLALAHALKSRFPRIRTVMGGANCEGSMGEALHRHFPFLDYVFTGASDETFPEFVLRLADGRPFDDIPGIAWRDGDRRGTTGPSRPVADLNALPFPDYDDYVAQMAPTSIARELPVRLQIETSRGCWWGMKQHCTFCGMNAATMRFSSKRAARVLEELEWMVERYGIRGIDAVDAILDVAYFKDLLPALRDRRLGVTLFYEIKANLRRDQVRLLAEAGVVFLQPGIESFSTRLLARMRKGISSLQNLQMLKWCRTFGIEPTWNVLYGFPGENAGDYDRQAALLEKIPHLSPPRGCGALRMDRFSPHFEKASEFGLVDVRPLEAYRHIYPLTEAETFEVAYFFDYRHADGLDPEAHIGGVKRAIARWRDASGRGASLTSRPAEDGDLVVDDRREPSRPRERRFHSWRRAVIEHCEQLRGLPSIVRRVAEHFAGLEEAEREVRAFLDELVALDLVVEEDRTYLALPIATHLSDGDEPVEPARKSVGLETVVLARSVS